MKLVIFDFDGVICDSWRLHARSYEKTFAAFGKKLRVKTLKKFRGWYDSHWENNYYRAGFAEKDVPALQREYWANVDYGKAEVYAGVKSALQQLSKKHVLALVSTTRMKEIKQVLAKNGLKRFFKILESGEDRSDKKAKIVDAMGRAGAKPSETVMIGDTVADVESGRQNGVKTIAVSYGWTSEGKLKKAKPFAMVSKPGGIPRAVESFFSAKTRR